MINGPDHNHVALDVVALTFTPDGKRLGEPVGRKIDIQLSSDKLAAIQKDGLLYRDALDLSPGDYLVRFVVRDDATGRMGSVAAPLNLQ